MIYDDTPERNMVGEFCVECMTEFLEAVKRGELESIGGYGD